MSPTACLLGVLSVLLAFIGALSNAPPSFSQAYYVDSVSEDVQNDGLLTSVACSDADGDNLVVSVTSSLSFETRVTASDTFTDEFDIIVASSSIDLSTSFDGVRFTIACSDGVANDTARVSLNVIPASGDVPQFVMPPDTVPILASAQPGELVAKFRASLFTVGGSITYDLDDLVKDSVPFMMGNTSGELTVSGALLQERYELIVLAVGNMYTTRVSVVVLVNFQPMFEQSMVSATVDAGEARIGDTISGLSLCSDQNLESTANGNLSLVLQGSISAYFKITQEGSLEVAALLRSLSGGTYQLTVNCSDAGMPQALSDELIVSLQLVPAGPGEDLNNPPLFSQDVYIDLIASGPTSSGGLLTTLFCTDKDDPNGVLLTVSVQPGLLPFSVRVVKSSTEANGYDIITNEMVDFEQHEETGLQFNATCSDGTESAEAYVVLDFIPSSGQDPVIVSTPDVYLLETTANNTDIGTFSIQSGTTSHTAPQYSVTEVLGDEMAVFRIHPSLGNLSVSGVFNDERYLVVVTVFNGDATSSAVIEVTINFKPVFTTTSFRTTVTVSNVAVGDSIGAVSCTDQNSQDTSNGILTLRLHLNASASSYFSIAENGTVFVSGDLNRLRALQSTVNGYIICADNGQPERLSSTIKVSIALQGPGVPGTGLIPIAVGALLAVLFLWLLILIPCMIFCLVRRCSKMEKNKQATKYR